MIIPEYREPIYLEGGPWENSYWRENGRADFVLLRPIDKVILYPGEYSCEYERTDRIWWSPIFHESHTIFQFTRRL